MAPVKRHVYEAEFKLKAISHAVDHGNRATAKEFNINESMVRKWRKQEDELRQVKKTKQEEDEEKMREWLREVYVKRPDGFFHTSPSLLIFDSMRAHLTNTVKNQVKQTNSELAVIPGGLTKELQPLDIGVNRAFKVKLRAAWEHWMTEGEHTFTKTGRQRRASYATICRWIVDAWAKVSVLTVVRAFTKAGIIAEQPSNSNKTDSDNDEREPGILDAEIAQLLNSDTEDEEFDGFVEDE